MANAVMEIEAPRDITRQILRHRSFSFQELSGRYAEMQNFCHREARLQDTKNRQNSIECQNEALTTWWELQQTLLLKHAKDLYQHALDEGIAKEQARAILPEGLTMSRMYMNGTIRSWITYINLRSGLETQKEHRMVAVLAKKELETHFPNIVEMMK
jgi:thymidylate synthase (FAD)